MSPAEKQQLLLDEFLSIPDVQERLAAIVTRAQRDNILPTSHRTEANRVPGCISSVWLVGKIDVSTRRLRLLIDADSPLVKGLVSLLCELYDDSIPNDAAAFNSDLFDKLHIMQNLSPTRRNGLASVQARIRTIALSTSSI